MNVAIGPGATRGGIGLALVVLIALPLLVAPRSHAAEGAYEPNDAVANAAGPLLTGGTYAAGLERQDDKDLFFFHVTSPNTPRAEVTVTNLGSGGRISDLNVTILDASMTPVAGAAYIRVGEARTVAVALKPQKYYVEIVGGEGFGTAYSLVPGGEAGAFGPYADIATRCATATQATARSRVRLNRAEAKLQRAIARVQRARYGGPTAREGARVAYRKARARLRSERRAVSAAVGDQEPWCSIAP